MTLQIILEKQEIDIQIFDEDIDILIEDLGYILNDIRTYKSKLFSRNFEKKQIIKLIKKILFELKKKKDN